MINRNKIVVFVAFLGTLFFMTMFAGGTTEPQRIVTRNVTFKDGVTNEELSNEIVELGKSVRVPLVPEHEELEFDGWYTEEGERVTDFSEILADMTLTARFRDLEPLEDEEEIEDTPIVTPPIRRPLATLPRPGVIAPIPPIATPEPTPEPEPVIELLLDIVDGKDNLLEDGQHVNPNLLPGEDLKLKITAPQGYQVSANGKLLIDVPNNYSISDFEDGIYTFVLAKDNKEVERNIVIDTEAPVIPVVNFNGFESGKWYNTDVTLIFESEDNLTKTEDLMFVYTIDYNGRIPIWSDPVSSPMVFSKKPPKAVKVAAIDKAGNMSQPSANSFVVNIDKDIPAKPIVKAFIDDNPDRPYDFGTPTSENVRIFLITDKNSEKPIAGLLYEYKIEGTNDWIQYKNPIIPAGFAIHTGYPGELFDTTFIHDVRFRVSDTAGNISEETDIFHIHINKETPIIKLIDGLGNEINNESHVNPELLPGGKLYIEVNSIAEYILYKNDNIYNSADVSSSLDLTSLNEGTYKFKVVNNVGTPSDEFIIHIDKTPPAVPTINAGNLVSGTWYNHDVTLEFTSSDNMTPNDEIIFEKSIGYDGRHPKFGELIESSYKFTETPSPVKVMVRAIDKAGNVSESTSESEGFIVKIDKRTPTKLNVFGFINDDVNQPYEFGKVIQGGLRVMLYQDIKQDSTTSELIYEYQIEDTEEWIILTNYKFLQLPNPVGPKHKGFMFDEDFNHKVKFRMRTSAGNVGPETDYYHININTTTIKLLDGDNNPILSGGHVNPINLPQERMTLEVQSNSDYQVLINNEAAFSGNASGSFNLSYLEEDEYEIKVINSMGSVTNPINIIVDKTPPEIPIITELNNIPSYTWTNQDVTLILNSSDNYSNNDEITYERTITVIGPQARKTWGIPIERISTFTENISSSPLENTIHVRAIDKAGNISEPSIEHYRFRIDKLVPGELTVHGVYESTNTYYDFDSVTNDDLKIFLIQNKSNSYSTLIYEYKIEGTDDWIKLTGLSQTRLPDGTTNEVYFSFTNNFNHKIRFRVRDTAGNVGPESGVYHIQINKIQ